LAADASLVLIGPRMMLMALVNSCACPVQRAASTIVHAAASVRAARTAPQRVRSAGVARGAPTISTVKPPYSPRGERKSASAARHSINQCARGDSCVFPPRVNARARAIRIPLLGCGDCATGRHATDARIPPEPWFGRISPICCMLQIGFWPFRPAVRPCPFPSWRSSNWTPSKSRVCRANRSDRGRAFTRRSD